jgi:hypothetical protein
VRTRVDMYILVRSNPVFLLLPALLSLCANQMSIVSLEHSTMPERVLLTCRNERVSAFAYWPACLQGPILQKPHTESRESYQFLHSMSLFALSHSHNRSRLHKQFFLFLSTQTQYLELYEKCQMLL